MAAVMVANGLAADVEPNECGTWACPLTAAQVREILAPGLAGPVVALGLASPDGPVYARAARAHGERGPAVEVVAPVVVQGTAVAAVRVTGAGAERERVEAVARLTAAYVSAAWQAAREIDSLAGEVVHAYEELHLLYELGAALTGQLTVARAADLILAKILNVLHATDAELVVDDPAGPVRVRRGAGPAGAGAQRLEAPLQNNGQRLGAIVLARPRDAAPFSSADGKLLDAVGAFAGSAIRNAQLYPTLRRQADTDALTGLANHRAIQERLDEELAHAAAAGQPLAVLMIDVDDFKLFNDTYGHLVGDQILRLASRTLKEACRDTDVIGRYGGDEFIVLLPGADRAGASDAAHRILALMAARSVRAAGQDPLPIALSIGVALYPDDATLKHDILSHADAALYETKRSGGNGVRHHQGIDEVAYAPVAEGACTTFSALQGLVNAVDAKDRYTRDHSDAVTEGALLLAERLGLSPEACGALRIAGLLHDVGKIGIPDRILRKPGRLTDEEYRIMQQHVSLSELIIKEVPSLVDVLGAVASHHERYDGRGYPRGLRGEAIPLLGRIMALADACAAMLLNRPYRRGLGWPEVAAELRRGAGTQFDPALVEPFIEAIEHSTYLTAIAPQPPAGPAHNRQLDRER
nr:diguanylate cyclase [Thermomicrobiales bacterium]